MEVDTLTNLDEYQRWVKECTGFKAAYSRDGRMELVWACTGLASEAGEVLGEVEKTLRKNDEASVRKDKILDELGDVLWYAAAVCNAYGVSMDSVIEHNIKKINERVYSSEVLAHAVLSRAEVRE